MISNVFLAAAMAATPEQTEMALRILQGKDVTEKTIPSAERFITATEMAKVLGFSRTTLWRWKLPCHPLRGRPRYRISEVLAYMQSQEFTKKSNDTTQTKQEKK